MLIHDIFAKRICCKINSFHTISKKVFTLMKKVFENYPHSHSICKKGVFKPVKSLEIFQTLGILHRYLLSENFWQKFQTTFEFMRNHENAAEKGFLSECSSKNCSVK